MVTLRSSHAGADTLRRAMYTLPPNRPTRQNRKPPTRFVDTFARTVPRTVRGLPSITMAMRYSFPRVPSRHATCLPYHIPSFACVLSVVMFLRAPVAHRHVCPCVRHVMPTYAYAPTYSPHARTYARAYHVARMHARTPMRPSRRTAHVVRPASHLTLRIPRGIRWPHIRTLASVKGSQGTPIHPLAATPPPMLPYRPLH